MLSAGDAVPRTHHTYRQTQIHTRTHAHTHTHTHTRAQCALALRQPRHSYRCRVHWPGTSYARYLVCGWAFGVGTLQRCTMRLKVLVHRYTVSSCCRRTVACLVFPILIAPVVAVAATVTNYCFGHTPAIATLVLGGIRRAVHGASNRARCTCNNRRVIVQSRVVLSVQHQGVVFSRAVLVCIRRVEVSCQLSGSSAGLRAGESCPRSKREV